MRLFIRLACALLLAAAPGCAGSGAPDPTTAASTGAQMAVDPAAGAVGPLKLGMTVAEAQAAFGPPELAYDDFLSWRGGKVTATVVAGQLDALRVSDRTFSVGGFHVGESLDAAKHMFPGGLYRSGEVPYYQLPGIRYAWLEVVPGVDQEVLSVNLSRGEPAGDVD